MDRFEARPVTVTFIPSHTTSQPASIITCMMRRSACTEFFVHSCNRNWFARHTSGYHPDCCIRPIAFDLVIITTYEGRTKWYSESLIDVCVW